jgi:hypothetical protein
MKADFSRQHQSQIQLIQKEAIFFSGYGIKIPNHNTQIPNNKYLLFVSWCLCGYSFRLIRVGVFPF